MFSIFNRRPSKEPFFPITTDIHSHILPGIDDGSPDIETSIQLVKGLMSVGVNKSIATPHVISDIYRNTPDTITVAQQALQRELDKQGLDFKLSAAAEYMMDAAFFGMLDSGAPMLTVKDKLLLTEFSYMAMPENPKLMSFTIITSGYTPILAHPERYGYFHNSNKNYHLLQELGFLLQVNLLSLTGYYGPAVTKAAKYILKNGLATYTATDLHHPRHLAALLDPKNQKVFREVFGEEKWNKEF